MLGFLFDDLPSDANTVTVSPHNPRLARVRFEDYSDYAKRGAEQVPKMIDKLAAALPIERVVGTALGATAAHIQGTVVMATIRPPAWWIASSCTTNIATCSFSAPALIRAPVPLTPH